jgi:SpoVK/Ycf46/Vps4 family AAA+-type ATPase
VYIDEIDASCPTRQSGHTTCIDAEVPGQLLQELDGIKTSDERLGSYSLEQTEKT